jgi:hypothetical protein
MQCIDHLGALVQQIFQPADKVLLVAQLAAQANVLGFERLALAFEWQDLT